MRAHRRAVQACSIRGRSIACTNNQDALATDGTAALLVRIKPGVDRIKGRLAATCGETANSLSDYLEHDLAILRRRRIARHLRRCLNCRSLLDSLAWTVEQLRKLGTSDVAQRSVAESVIDRIRVAPNERSS